MRYVTSRGTKRREAINFYFALAARVPCRHQEGHSWIPLPMSETISCHVALVVDKHVFTSVWQPDSALINALELLCHQFPVHV